MSEPLQISLSIATLASVLLLASCSGSGEGLDENGLPFDDTAMQPAERGTIAFLQANIFSPICSECHFGSNAPFGLRLDSEESSYSFLVDVSSGERPELLRVSPGNPDESYIVLKIEGDTSIVGGQMPLNRPPLSPDDIEDLRDWISTGALRVPLTEATADYVADMSMEINGRISSPPGVTAIDRETPDHIDNIISRLFAADYRQLP